MKAVVINTVKKDPVVFELDGTRYKLINNFSTVNEISKLPESLGEVERLFAILAVLMNDYLRREGAPQIVEHQWLMDILPTECADELAAMVAAVLNGGEPPKPEPGDDELDEIIEGEVPEETKN